MFAFAVDVIGEGPDGVAAAVQETGVGGISLATAYHHARDILAHNPHHMVYFHEGGTVFFHPESDRYGLLRPQPGSLARSRDPLGELCDATERRSMQARAWTVYLHNSRLGHAHPECAPENALGDRILTELCPAHPEVRRYAVALTADLGRYPIASIMAEALHFRTIEHGFHHERYFLDLGETARFLLGLCFCESCLAVAGSAGVDGGRLRELVAERLLGWLHAGRGGHEPLEALPDELAGDELKGYLETRANTVTSLAAAVQDAASAAEVRLTFSAHGGSAKAGRTRSSDSVDTAWTLGVDIEEVSAVVDEFEVLGYAADASDIQALQSSYGAAIGDRADVAVALRPMWPDTASGEDLAEKVQVVAARGAKRIDFYHYGLMPARSLDWTASAMRLLAEG